MSKGYLEYQLPFIFNSSEEAGAQGITEDGSSFHVILDQPIFIPREAKNVSLSVSTSTIWNSVYNIEKDVNDKVSVSYNTGIVVVKTITVEAGLYDLDHLAEEIGRELLAAGWPQDLFTLVPDNASQKSVIQINYSGVQIDFTIAENFAEILGFEERLVPLLGDSAGIEYHKSDTTANFNKLDYFLIHSDLVSRGIRVNSQYSSVIELTPVTSAVGSQIINTPNIVQHIPTPELAGERRKTVRLWLTDQDNKRVDTNGEIWSVRVVIHYYM